MNEREKTDDDFLQEIVDDIRRMRNREYELIVEAIRQMNKLKDTEK